MINPMKKVLLAARTSDSEKVLKLLRTTEMVHVEPVKPEQISVPVSVSESLEKCQKAIALLAQIPECKGDRFAMPGTPARLVQETIEHDEAVSDQKEKLVELLKELEETSTWGDLGLREIRWLEKEGLKIAFFRGPGEKGSEIEAECCALIKESSADALYVTASRQPVKVPAEFSEVPRPARESSEIEEEILACRKAISDHQHALSCLSMRLGDIEADYRKLLNKKRYYEVESGLLNEDEIVILSGWIPEELSSSLSLVFDEEGIPVGIDFSDPGEDEIPPTHLKNPVWAQSIQPLYDFMGVVPSYNEPDSSPLFLSMLTIFAAFLIADAGYGLIVLAALLGGYKTLVSKGADRRFLNLGIFLFGGITVYGVLTNTWFGETFKIIKSHNFDPNTNEGMIFLQGLCFLMGAIHLTVAHIWKVSRRKLDISVLGEVGWICFLWGMYGVICSLILKQEFVMPWSWVSPLFKIAFALILIFTAPSWNIFSSIAAGVGAIMQNASNCFSDIVSYIRLWAVGLAGGKVAMAFNDIAAMLPVFVLRLPIWIVGHGINIILGVIAILAHGVRLNLLEFSNHLELEWSGRQYDPFKEIK